MSNEGFLWFAAGFVLVLILAYTNHLISLQVLRYITNNWDLYLKFYSHRSGKPKKYENRWKKLWYIIKHKIAYLYIEIKYWHKITWRGIFHDMDKVLLILFCWDLSVEEINYFHKIRSRHHCRASTHEDRLYQIIDYECARYTKKDKPMSASQYVEYMWDTDRISKELYDEYNKVIDELKLPKYY